MCKHVCHFAKTRAVIEDAAVKSVAAQVKLPVNAEGDVCARVAGGVLEAAAKTVTVPTSPAEVQAMFVGFDDDQPQVHEVVDRVRGTHHEYEMFVRKVQDVIVVSGTLILRVLRFETSLGFVGTAANLTCSGDVLRHLGDFCGFVGTTANAFCFEELRRHVEDSCVFVGGSANAFCFEELL